ncbi:hypothetical protein AC579_988 [Pseudocercospora musae]|uniref:Uncharacterized protein n=1 Tax=Pseudocercospora musae TaxID=113226 RepID=A0A139I1C7_9PEZI|nr:hypothetical protein AC579_988 [Pseudocercospora musae]
MACARRGPKRSLTREFASWNSHNNAAEIPPRCIDHRDRSGRHTPYSKHFGHELAHDTGTKLNCACRFDSKAVIPSRSFYMAIDQRAMDVVEAMTRTHLVTNFESRIDNYVAATNIETTSATLDI